MDFIRKIINREEKLHIYYPPDEIDGWNMLKKRYSTRGYYWVDFSIEPSLAIAKKMDKKNTKKYTKMKKKEMKLRNSFRGTGNITVVHPPPKPNNEERFLKLRKWSENNYYNISMITICLFCKYNLKPCRDYEPDNLLDVYNRYSSGEQDIYLKNIQHPSVPPPVPDLPPPQINNFLENDDNPRRESYQNIFPTAPPPDYKV